MKTYRPILLILLFSLATFAWTLDKKPAGKKRAATATSRAKGSATKKKSATSSAAKRQRAKQHAQLVRRTQRLNRAFVASADLKPMARQLISNRTRPAYAGVEAYARKHAHDDAGALASLVLGYAHVLDHDYAKAIDPLKRAQALAGDLNDYPTYFLGMAYGASGNGQQVVATLRDFATKFPESLFLRDAADVYASGLMAEGKPAEAAAFLEKYRHPARADIELGLGRAYAKAGEPAKAADALRHLYFGMPLAPEAADAKLALDALSATAAVPPASFADRKARADLLAQARHHSDAAREYRALLADAPADRQNAIRAALGVALHRSGNDREARDILEALPDSADETQGQRLLALAEMARGADDEDRFTRTLSRMRETASTSPAFEEALLLGGNMYLLRRDYDKAIDHYRELQQRFPAGKRASYAHWKAAWLTLRQGRTGDAKREFEEEVTVYPGAAEVPAAMYWRARLAEEDRDLVKAHAWYSKLADRFPHYYYAEMARERLRTMTAKGDAAQDPILARIPPVSLPPTFASAAVPEDNLHLAKSRLLENGGLTDFAIRELRAAADDGGAAWANTEIAKIYQDNGQYHRALQTLKRAVPSYYALEIDALPRPYWEGLFPRPYWTDLKRHSLSNRLDPFLVASLIRQESEFNPGAVSRADALGLMQLLPGTGKKVAREMRIRRFSTAQLLTPTTNIELGTRYFQELVTHFDGRLEYALAAYNAGADRVQTWLANGSFRDPQEFVESIPFTETREYVQAILRNASIYRRIYGTP